MAKRGNGEGSIYFSDKLNRWVGQYTYLGQRKSVYGKTRKEVAQKINTAINDIKERTYINKSDVTIGELIYNQIQIKKESNIVIANTYRRDMEDYNCMCRISNNFMNSRIQKISSKDIQNFLNACIPYSNSTIDKIYRQIKSAFRKAISLNIVACNPFDDKYNIIKPKSTKQDKKVEALTLDEQRHLLDVIDYSHPYTNIILLMLYTGMRVGEVLALELSSITESSIRINKTLSKDENYNYIIGKSTKTYTSQREITIIPGVGDILKKSIAQAKSDKLLFSDNKGEFIKPYEINAYLLRLNKKFNISSSLHSHMLRHTFATRCIESGMTAVVLAKKLGHKDVAITLNTYTSIFEKYEGNQNEKFLKYLEAEKLQLH